MVTISSTWSTRILLAATLAGGIAMPLGAQQQQQPGQPVPITNDTPAATSKAMPPETTPVPGSATTSPANGPTKTQRKQQKTSTADKSAAKAKKQNKKAAQDAETPSQPTPPTQ